MVYIENMGVIMVKLFLRALLLLVIIGVGVHDEKLLGMQQNFRQRGLSAEEQAQALLRKQEKEAARIAQAKLSNESKKIYLDSLELDEKLKKAKENKWDEEVQARANIFKGILYGLLVPGTALINYNMGNFGINQIGGIVMLVVLIHYGVIHAFLVCLSNGVQHVKQIPLSKAKNLISGINKIPVDVQEDLIGKAFDSDSDSDLD